MHNYFFNNSLLSKLCILINELTDEEDKIAISKLIKKQMPLNTQHNFSLIELASITKREASNHSYGVGKSHQFAKNYLYEVHKIDMLQEYEEEQYEGQFYDEHLEGFMWNNEHINVISNMVNDFQITRALIYKNTSVDVLKEVAESFDLYTTNVFIEHYLKLKVQYDLHIAIIKN